MKAVTALGATGVVLYRAVSSRRRLARAIAWVLAAGAVLAAPAVGAQSTDAPGIRFIEHRQRFEPAAGAPPIELNFLIAPEAARQTERVVSATQAALRMLVDWFGPLPSSSLTVAGIGWRDVPEVVPGRVAVRLRWLTPARDQATERELIAGIVRQYFPAGEPRDAFARALHAYVAARASHHQLEGSNFATLRFFGGSVPFSLRSVLLSPPVADPRPRAFGFDDPEPADPDLVRGVRAFQTVERLVGWPTMLQALSTMRATAGLNADAAALAAALSEARGTDLRTLVPECFRSDAVFDYAVADLQSRPAAGLVETTLTIARRGTGVFTTGGAAGGRNLSMPLRVRFADGTEVRDFFDGAAQSTALVYTAKSAAVSATIDPDVILLLDLNRANNAIVRDAGTVPLGIRLALNWMAWLQNAMLSYTALS
jgi:hypothetical protein